MTDTDIRRGNGFVDITGESFGHLTVLDQAPSIEGAAAWLCRCICGEQTVAKGIELRKGNRASCGCKNRVKRRITPAKTREKPTPPTPPEGRYRVTDLDGFVALVESTHQGEALVEFDVEAKAWQCSVHGLQGKVGCGHVAAVTARLPVKTATAIASIVAPAGDRSRTVKAPGKVFAPEIRQARARAAKEARGAIERAERMAQRDREHLQVTSAVTVRQATPEDRERLAAMRRRRGVMVGADR